MNYSFIEPLLPLDKVISNNITNQKSKFITKTDPSVDVPGHYNLNQKKSQIIDNETNLLTPNINEKHKTQFVLKKNLNPFNFEVDYKDNLNNQPKEPETYFSGYYNGPGRGFGNLDIANDVRQSNSSRDTTKENREKLESHQMYDMRFQFLNKNVQDPNHIVMPIPRGGIQTRKESQLLVNANRTVYTKNQYMNQDIIKTVNFNY